MTLSFDLSQFYETYFEESQELLENMENLLLAIDLDEPDKEECNAIFRAAHSIKGGAATFEMADMVRVTHIMESLLDRIRKDEERLTERHVNVFLQAKDLLKQQLHAHRNKAPLDEDAALEVMCELQELASGKGVAVSSRQEVQLSTEVSVQAGLTAEVQGQAASSERPTAAQGASFFRLDIPESAESDFKTLFVEQWAKQREVSEHLPDGKVRLKLETDLNEEDLLAICSFLIDPELIKIVRESPQDGAVGQTEPVGSTAGAEPVVGLEAECLGVFESVDLSNSTSVQAHKPSTPQTHGGAPVDGKPASVASKAAKASSQDSPSSSGQDSHSIRVSLDKIDQLINLAGELVITQAMIDQHANGLDPAVYESLINNFATLARNTRDLQEAIMSIRMMPIESVFSRFPRMTRELSAKLGKQIRLVTQGGATELDKGLIERITDPLTHLIRNAIDHGLEPPEIRRSVGKSEVGTLLLSAAHEGGNIIIEVSDDGAGLNRERILAKAHENGLSLSDEASDEDVWQIIFAPGFSTCSEVTDVSGRGVGMDVVKRNIAAMGGRVDIHSVRGQGSTFRISLPLTLAILEGMSVRTGEEIYILPLANVIESLRPNAENTWGVTGKGRLIRVRGEYLPLIPLYEVFGIEARFTKPTDGIVVVLESEGKKAALFVDNLVGQQQVVVKNIESNYRRIPGISGATILGDGNVSLILNVPSLLKIGGNPTRSATL